MANVISRAMNVPTSVTQGTAIRVDDLTDIAIYVFGTFVQTIQLQVSPDNAEWFDEGAAHTVKGNQEANIPCRFMRLDVTAHTSGQATVLIVGEQRQG